MSTMLKQFLTLCVFARCCGATLHVSLNAATVVGTDIALGNITQEIFAGIPFATASRFSPAVQVNYSSSSTIQADSFGPSCAQLPPTMNPVAEDCLTMNIIRPEGTNTNSKLPVMVWLYGGGFLQGESVTFNGSAIVGESVTRGTPVIYANLNYRLGPFGFPQGVEAEKLGALNLGLKDQIVALEWLQANIASFGGDPSKVTVFGQSAGSIAVSILYLNDKFETLARGAIMESGSQGTIPLYNATVREPAWAAFVNATPECAGARPDNTFDCLRRASLTTLLAAWNTSTASDPQLFPFAPVIDGNAGLIPDLPASLLAQGRFARVPFIAGTVLDEGTKFVSTSSKNMTDANVIESITLLDKPYNNNPGQAFEAVVEEILKLYPNNPVLGSPFGTGNDTFGLDPQFKRLAAIIGDIAFQSLRRAWTDAAAQFGVKTFGYIFTNQDSVDPDEPWLGVIHASEIPYVYGDPVSTASSVALSSSMMNYWISFATSLDPNDGRGVQRPYWPQYDVSDSIIMEFGEEAYTIQDDYRKVQIEFLNSVPTVLAN